MMRYLRGRIADDTGSIMLAMFALVVTTTIALVGLSSVIGDQLNARHDIAFEQSLAGAETGLSQLVAQIRANPSASSFASVSGTVSSSGATYSASATGGANSWTITSTGTATHGNRTVTRTVRQQVATSDLLTLPLVGLDSLSLTGTSGTSGVDRYDSSASSNVCDTGGTQQSMGYSGARMCTAASPALGNVATNGGLTMSGTDIDNIAEADIYDAPLPGFTDPDAAGHCVGDSGTCASSKVVTHDSTLTYPLSGLCANGIGAGAAAYDGSYALAANAVYNFTDVTLNAAAIANLGNLSSSRIIICFNGTLSVPPLVPLNSTVASLVPLRLNPRPPSTLLLISTCGSSGYTATTCPSSAPAPTVDFGLGLPTSTSLSAVVYAPNATCSASGHVDVYGAVVCKSVSASKGMNVHYDTQLGSLPFDQMVSVSQWHEVH